MAASKISGLLKDYLKKLPDVHSGANEQLPSCAPQNCAPQRFLQCIVAILQDALNALQEAAHS